MAFWTDNFNRANETPLSGTLYGKTTAGTFDLAINANHIYSGGDSDDGEAYYLASSGVVGADQYSQAAITPASDASEQGFGPMVRHSGTSTRTFIRAIVDADPQISVRKFTAGASAVLGTRLPPGWAAGDVLRIEISGVSPNIVIKVFQNGVQVGADMTGLTAADSGLVGWAYSSTASVATLDDWEGGDLTLSVPQKLRPDGDIVTTGWTTTPLWSKIDENTPGGDVITATSS